MNKVLISFLGKGDYKKIAYTLNEKVYESELSIYPIKEEFNPDRVYVIGTKESRWDLLTGLQYEKVIIPAGNSAEDFWKIIDILKDGLELQNSVVAFDITHCFRSIPIFVVIYIRFLKQLHQSTEIRHIYYGILESKQIIDLRPMLDLLEWLDALSAFKKNGDLDGFCLLMERAERDLKKQFKDKIRLKIGELKNNLRDLSSMAQMTYVPQLGEISRTLSGLINAPEIEDEARNYLKPFYLLLPEIRSMMEKFRADSEWEAQLKMARWYIENSRPSQAVLVLREAIVTYRCWLKKLDPYDRKIREKVEDELNEERKKSHDDLLKLWNRVIDTRNNVAHVLMKRLDKKIDPQGAVNKVKKLVEEAELILKPANDKLESER